MADLNLVDTDNLATVDVVADEQLDNGGSKVGTILKWGAAALGVGLATGVGVSLGDRIVTKVCDTIEIKAAGRKAKKEAEAKVKAEQKAKAEAEAKKGEIPTSEEAEKILKEE